MGISFWEKWGITCQLGNRMRVDEIFISIPELFSTCFVIQSIPIGIGREGRHGARAITCFLLSKAKVGVGILINVLYLRNILLNKTLPNGNKKNQTTKITLTDETKTQP